MKINSSHVNFSTLLILFALVLSSVQHHTDEQYKYNGVDFGINSTKTPFECLVDPVQNIFKIYTILVGFNYFNTNHQKQSISNPYANQNIFKYDFLQTLAINPQYLNAPHQMILIQPFISVLHKSQPVHSLDEDNPSLII